MTRLYTFAQGTRESEAQDPPVSLRDIFAGGGVGGGRDVPMFN